MRDVLCFLSIALVLVVLVMTVATTANAQFVYAEQGDASNVFSECQQTGQPYASNVQVTGVLSQGRDADIYCFDATGWSLPTLTGAWVRAEFSDGRIAVSELYVKNHTGYDEYSKYSRATNEARGFSLAQVSDPVSVGLSDRNAQFVADPNRLEPDGFAGVIDRTYTLTIDEPRPHARIQELTDLNQRDASQITQVADCDADLWTWRYRDLQLGTFNEPGEQLLAGVQLPRACLDHGFQFRSQTIIDVLVLNPQTGEQYLVRKFDYDDPHPIGDTTPGNFGDWAPVIRPGELAALVPSDDPDPVLLMGIMVVNSEQSNVGTEPDKPTIVSGALSAHPVRESIVAIEVINPRVNFDVATVTLAEVDGVDSIDVTLPVSSHQVMAFDLTLTRLQDGAVYDDPAGSVIATDTVRAVTPQNAVDRLHAVDGYVLTKRLPVTDLQAGDGVQLDVVPVGRGVYSDSLRLDALAQSLTYTMQTATDAEDNPLAGSLDLSVFPNPTTGSATAAIAVGTPGQVRWTVIDRLGRQVASGDRRVPAGSTQVPLDLRGFAPGVYVLRVESAQGVAVQRLTLAR